MHVNIGSQIFRDEISASRIILFRHHSLKLSEAKVDSLMDAFQDFQTIEDKITHIDLWIKSFDELISNYKDYLSFE